MIPAARRAHFHEMNRKFESFGDHLRNFRLASRATSPALQGISIDPPGQPHLRAAHWAWLVHVNAMVLCCSAEEKIGITQFFTPYLPSAKLTQMLCALPCIGDLIAVGH